MDTLRAATEPGWALLPSILNAPSRPRAPVSLVSTMPARLPWGRVGRGPACRPGGSFCDHELATCLDKQDQKKLNINNLFAGNDVSKDNATQYQLDDRRECHGEALLDEGRAAAAQELPNLHTSQPSQMHGTQNTRSSAVH